MTYRSRDSRSASGAEDGAGWIRDTCSTTAGSMPTSDAAARIWTSIRPPVGWLGTSSRCCSSAALCRMKGKLRLADPLMIADGPRIWLGQLVRRGRHAARSNRQHSLLATHAIAPVDVLPARNHLALERDSSLASAKTAASGVLHITCRRNSTARQPQLVRLVRGCRLRKSRVGGEPF